MWRARSATKTERYGSRELEGIADTGAMGTGIDIVKSRVFDCVRWAARGPRIAGVTLDRRRPSAAP